VSKIKCVFFDLDETLYPRDAGVMQAIRDRIREYMVSRLKMPPEQADALRREYLHRYGTTLAGLQRNFPDRIDEQEYQEFVHEIPLDQLLEPNEKLAAALRSIKAKKVVLTNASREHAESVLKALGVLDLIDRIIDIESLGYVNKPNSEAYEKALEIMGIRGDEAVLVEDNVPNLLPAKKLGMYTVLVDGEKAPGVDFVIDEASEITKVLKVLGEECLI
jgi:putative hydrolase of the HAD superfamily